ncbi:hypothetical protein [Bacillus sp. AK031]
MLKKLIKHLLKSKSHRRHYSSSDSWKSYKSHKHKHYGHHHYKKKYGSSRSFSSFFSS